MEKRICKCCGEMAIQESKFDLINANVVDNFFNDEFAIILNVCEKCGCIHYGDVVDFDTDLNTWYKDIVNSRMYQMYHSKGLLFDMFELMYSDSVIGKVPSEEYIKNEFYLAFVDYIRTGVPSDVLPIRLIRNKFLNHFETYLQASSDGNVDVKSVVYSLESRPKHFLSLYIGYIDILRLEGYTNFAGVLCTELLDICRERSYEDDVPDEIYTSIPVLSVELALINEGYTDICTKAYANTITIRLMNDITNAMNEIDDLGFVVDDPDDTTAEDLKLVTDAFPELTRQAAINKFYSNSKADIRQGLNLEPEFHNFGEASAVYAGWEPVTNAFDDFAGGPVNEFASMVEDDLVAGADIDSENELIGESEFELSDIDSNDDLNAESDLSLKEPSHNGIERNPLELNLDESGSDLQKDSSVISKKDTSIDLGSEDFNKQDSFDESDDFDEIPDESPEDDFDIPDEDIDVPDDFDPDDQ